MAGLVEKVKQSIRNRSRSRKSGSGSDFGTPEIGNRASVDSTRRSNQFQDERVGRSPQTDPAYHNQSGAAGLLNKSLPSEPAYNSSYSRSGTEPMERDGTQRGSISRKAVPNATEELVPDRSSSIQHHRHASNTKNSMDASRIDAEARSAMPSSYNASRSNDAPPSSYYTSGNHNRVPSSSLSGEQYGTTHNRDLSDGMDDMTLGSSAPRHQSGTLGVSESIKQRHHNASNDGIPPVPALASNQRGSGSQPTTNGSSMAGNQANEHMRLPKGFHMNTTEHTDVQTNWQPAVTRETIYRNRTEIIQEEITRDIHVHHYYTYLQPIKVVEVLPARHYFLDHKTGVKTEIATPLGWILPDDMQSRQPETASVKGWTRHYLVNEQNPNGIPEPPPLRHKDDHDHLQNTQSHHSAQQTYTTQQTRSTQPIGNAI
jgi:hypothetical protein